MAGVSSPLNSRSTALLVIDVQKAFEEIEAGRLKRDEELTVSAHAAAQPATELGLGAGQKITVKDTILAIILQSANDAAVTRE